MGAQDAIRPTGVDSKAKVFGLSESQIARRVEVIARAAGLTGWEFFSGTAGGWAWHAAWLRTARPTHEIEHQGRWKQGGGTVGCYTRGECAGSTLPYL